MTMAQGGLFNREERTNVLLATPSIGQSQSKKARYHRAYRSDPKNKDRINSQKKRRRVLKRECELGSVSSMFDESAARPAKSEQQTVGSTSQSQTNNHSLSDSCFGTSCELRDSSRNYCQKDQMSVATCTSENVIKEKSSNLDIQNQAELLSELRDSFRGIESALKTIQESVKPAIPELPINNEVEQQASVSGIAIANGDNLTKDTAGNQAEKPNFIAGFFHQISQIDGAAFARNFPAAIVLGFCAYYACLFVVEQTIPLYESLQFPNPQMACYEGWQLNVTNPSTSNLSR